MYLFQKAGKNLLKNKGRNIIMLILLSIVATSSIVALTIWNTTDLINKDMKNYYAGEVTLTSSDTSGNPQNSTFTADDYKKFADSSFLRSYVINKDIGINITGIKLLDGDTAPEGGGKGVAVNAHLTGLMDDKSSDDFSYGERKVISGNFPTNNTECIISSDLANLNHLTVGDTISFTAMNHDGEVKLTISGIFSDTTMAYPDNAPDHRYSYENDRNDIITTYDFFAANDHNGRDTASFLLRNSNDLTAFQSELYAKGLPTTYTVQYDTSRYASVEEQITKVSSVLSLFISIIILVAIGMVFLVNLLSLRERKYEIGVFRAIGMPKPKVALLLTSEMLLLALIGVVVAITVGTFINPMLTDFMKSSMEWNMPSALKHIISSINGTFSIKVTMELIAMTFALVVLAGSATLSSIMRFNPIKILSERN